MRDGEDGVDFEAQRRERADWISGSGISREEQCLAAAAAEVLLAAVAGFARLLHPVLAAEFLERGGVFPNFTQAAVLHVFEGEAGNDLRSVAGKRIAAWRDQYQLAAPAAHAGLGIFCVVIGDNEFDANPALKPFLCALDESERLI